MNDKILREILWEATIEKWTLERRIRERQALVDQIRNLSNFIRAGKVLLGEAIPDSIHRKYHLDEITEILEDFGRPLTIREIVARYEAKGYQFKSPRATPLTKRECIRNTIHRNRERFIQSGHGRGIRYTIKKEGSNEPKRISSMDLQDFQLA